jgi:hypothetical protein
MKEETMQQLGSSDWEFLAAAWWLKKGALAAKDSGVGGEAAT